MRLLLLSDLHLERQSSRFASLKLPDEDTYDLVVLAGDIHSHTHGLKWASHYWNGQKPVLYVAGNHEYYDAHLGLLEQMRNPVFAQSNVFFLEKEVFTVGDVRFLGCTLWTNFMLNGAGQLEQAMFSAEHGVNDFAMIMGKRHRPITALDMAKLHRVAAAWLTQELAKPWEGKTVVISHFAPHPGCGHPAYPDNALGPYFYCDMRWLMAKHKIDLWCYGHTHFSTDFIAENGCRVVSNQLGYGSEFGKTDFSEALVVEV